MVSCFTSVIVSELFTILLFQFHWLYFISFVLILLGLLVYSVRPVPNTERRGNEDTESQNTSSPGESQPLCHSVSREGVASAMIDSSTGTPDTEMNRDSQPLCQSISKESVCKYTEMEENDTDISVNREQEGVASGMIDSCVQRADTGDQQPAGTKQDITIASEEENVTLPVTDMSLSINSQLEDCVGTVSAEGVASVMIDSHRNIPASPQDKEQCSNSIRTDSVNEVRPHS